MTPPVSTSSVQKRARSPLPRRLLVTGGAGFIGSAFVRLCHRQGRVSGDADSGHCIVLDAMTYAGDRARLTTVLDASRLTQLVVGDICDRTLVDHLLRKYEIEAIVHFAAESHVDRSISGPAPFIQTNVVGTFTLLDAFRQHWDACGQPAHYRFLHVSTDEVYGSLAPDAPATSEHSPYAPNSPYAASKAGSDHLVRAYSRTYGLPTLITHCANNYGPYQYPEKLIPLMFINMLLGRSLPIYGDGQQRREWIHVDDHCDALLALLELGEPGERYNIGTTDEMTNLALVEMLCDLMDRQGIPLPISPCRQLIQFVRDRPGHDRRYSLNCTKLYHELGWQPKISLETGLKDTLTWYLTHRSWWEKLLSGDYQTYYQQQYGSRTSAP